MGTVYREAERLAIDDFGVDLESARRLGGVAGGESPWLQYTASYVE